MLILALGALIFAVVYSKIFTGDSEIGIAEIESTAIPVEVTEEEPEVPEPPHFIMLSDRKYRTGTKLSLLDLV